MMELPMVGASQCARPTDHMAQLAQVAMAARGSIFLRTGAVQEIEVGSPAGAVTDCKAAVDMIRRTVQAADYGATGNRGIECGNLGIAVEGHGAGSFVWLTSSRCLVALRSPVAEPAPFVALIRSRAGEFTRRHRELAGMSLVYESVTGSRSLGANAVPIGERILSRLSVATIVAETTGRVVYANHAALRRLARCAALKLSGDRLVAEERSVTRRLHDAIEEALADDGSSTVAISTGSDPTVRSANVICVTRLSDAEEHVLITFGDARPRGQLRDVVLTAMGLTPAERRVAGPVSEGLALDDAAREANVKLSTARSYVKSVFAKTGARRQSEFVARISDLTPPIVDPGP